MIHKSHKDRVIPIPPSVVLLQDWKWPSLGPPNGLLDVAGTVTAVQLRQGAEAPESLPKAEDVAEDAGGSEKNGGAVRWCDGWKGVTRWWWWWWWWWCFFVWNCKEAVMYFKICIFKRALWHYAFVFGGSEWISHHADWLNSAATQEVQSQVVFFFAFNFVSKNNHARGKAFDYFQTFTGMSVVLSI